MTQISFFVPGIPKPGGSKTPTLIRKKGGAFVTRPDGRPLIATRDASDNTDWKNACRVFARKAHTGPLLSGPINLTVTFMMPRPKGHFGSGKNAGKLKASVPAFPLKDPDRTKLLRCLEDALTHVLWVDDNLIVAGEIRKVWADETGPGAFVEVREIGVPSC